MGRWLRDYNTQPFTDEQLDDLEGRMSSDGRFAYDLFHRKLLATVRKLQKELAARRSS